MRRLFLLLAIVSIVALAGCGGDDQAEAPGGAGTVGDAAAGEQVFHDVASPACDTCHSLEAGVTLVGPSLNGIGATAGTIVDGMSAADYLHQSIVDPNAYVVEGFGSNIMPATYGNQLSDEQINDLVAFLLTQ